MRSVKGIKFVLGRDSGIINSHVIEGRAQKFQRVAVVTSGAAIGNNICNVGKTIKFLDPRNMHRTWTVVNCVVSPVVDFYKVLGVDYDATEDSIRSNYLRLALKWHPDKHSGEHAATLKFQKINEAYRVLSDPAKRQDYDMNGDFVQDYSISEYLNRFKGLILTCNGLGISNLSGNQAYCKTTIHIT